MEASNGSYVTHTHLHTTSNVTAPLTHSTSCAPHPSASTTSGATKSPLFSPVRPRSRVKGRAKGKNKGKGKGRRFSLQVQAPAAAGAVSPCARVAPTHQSTHPIHNTPALAHTECGFPVSQEAALAQLSSWQTATSHISSSCPSDATLVTALVTTWQGCLWLARPEHTPLLWCSWHGIDTSSHIWPERGLRWRVVPNACLPITCCTTGTTSRSRSSSCGQDEPPVCASHHDSSSSSSTNTATLTLARWYFQQPRHTRWSQCGKQHLAVFRGTVCC